MGKKFLKKLNEVIAEGSDEEVLTAFCEFFQRVEIAPQLVQDNDTGYITHQIMVIQCGDKFVASTPLAYEWPMQPINLPEEAKEAGVAVN